MKRLFSNLPSTTSITTQKGIAIPKPPRNFRINQTSRSRSITQEIRVMNVINNLPYGCIVEVEVSAEVDRVYYALQESRDFNTQLFYQWDYVPATEPVTEAGTKIFRLPAFSAHKFYSTQQELWFMCRPAHETAEGEDVLGAPIFYFPIQNHKTQQLGGYDFEVDFKGADVQLFQQVKPLIEKHFGKSALPGKVKVVYTDHDIYIPSTNTIYLSEGKRNLIHELLHANRKHLLFASEAFRFNEKTEVIEEAFAEGIANMIKDELNQQPNTHLEEGQVYGSTFGYNYDYRIQDRALITQNLQSTWGGILTLEHSRYFLGSEAFHKIALEYYMKEGKYFGKEYNTLYYDIIERTQINPDKELFYSISEQLMPTIEQKPCREWLDQQLVFNSEIIPGEKLFMHLTDYRLSDQWLGICKINLYETFRNGSDWEYGVRRYRKNASPVDIKVTHVPSGKIFFDSTIRIPLYEGGFGTIKLYFHHRPIENGLDFLLEQDDNLNLQYETIPVTSGLFKIELTSRRATKTYYRLLGDCMFEHRDQLLIGCPKRDDRNRTIQLVHENKMGQKTYLSSQRFTNQICAFQAPFIKDNNCEPGILQMIVTENGQTRTFQRNIGYGNADGGHQFWLFEMGEEGVMA